MGHHRRAQWNRNLRSNEPILSGSATFTNGSTTVTGNGTQFTRDFTPFGAIPPSSSPPLAVPGIRSRRFSQTRSLPSRLRLTRRRWPARATTAASIT